MNWRINSYTYISIHNGRGIAKFAFSIVLLLGLLLITTTSCKEECVDICVEFALVLDEADCSCVCPEKQTPFTINGYVYCIEESKNQDIYVLEDLNVSSILLKEGLQTPIPEIMISRVPKQLDTVESFYIWEYHDAPFNIYFELNVWKLFSRSSYQFYSTYFPITKFNNEHSPEPWLETVNRFFADMDGMFDGNLFPANKHGFGIIQFSENMDQMFFHYFGYNHLHDMYDAYGNLTTEEVFQFPYVPVYPPADPYNPYYTQLVFSKLNFD